MPKSNPKILVILGPTSSGKSDVAIKIAKKLNGEIISADSRQIFRGMDIGTGKVEGKLTNLSLRGPRHCVGGRSNPEQCKIKRDCFASLAMTQVFISRGIPHHMIDIISPRTDYNAAKFKKQSEKIIADILQRGKVPIICGGTGFWIKAIVDNVNFPEVKPDWELRKKLEKYSIEKLFNILKKLDPVRAKTIEAKNKVRLVRAIEICKAIKKVPIILSSPPAKGGNKRGGRDANYTSLQISLELSREKLYDNIEKRVKQRFAQGMVDEVMNLHIQGLSWKKIQSFGLAYFWIPEYLTGKITKQEMIDKVVQSERNYAKRQLTWFKRDKRINWLKNYSEIEKAAKKFLK